MKLLILSIPLLLSAVSATTRGEETVYRDDFEAPVVGQCPAPWKHAWGNAENSSFGISNERAVSGAQSLLFQVDGKMHGYAMPLPPTGDAGWLIVECRIFWEHTSANLGFELRDAARDGAGRLGSWQISAARLRGRSYRKNAVHPRFQSGHLPPGVWYRLRARIPLGAAAGDDAEIELFGPDGSAPVAAGKITWCFPRKMGMLYLNVGTPDTKTYRIFLDDLSVRRATVLR